MLVLQRHVGEEIVIEVGGETVIVRYVEQRGSQARIGIEAPRRVIVNRREVHDRIAANRKETAK